MDGWMDGWTDGGMEGWMDGRDGGMEGWRDVYVKIYTMHVYVKYISKLLCMLIDIY